MKQGGKKTYYEHCNGEMSIIFTDQELTKDTQYHIYLSITLGGLHSVQTQDKEIQFTVRGPDPKSRDRKRESGNYKMHSVSKL